MLTAWFDDSHPAKQHRCPSCGAGPNRECVTVDLNGKAVKLTGLHAERVAAARSKAVTP